MIFWIIASAAFTSSAFDHYDAISRIRCMQLEAIALSLEDNLFFNEDILALIHEFETFSESISEFYETKSEITNFDQIIKVLWFELRATKILKQIRALESQTIPKKTEDELIESF